MKTVACLVWLFLTARPALADAVSFYADIGIGIGRSHGSHTRTNGTVVEAASTVKLARAAIGFRYVSDRSVGGRLGFVVEVMDAGSTGVTRGLEGMLDTDLHRCWRIGLRAAYAGGEVVGGGTNGDGRAIAVGPRLYNHIVSRGLDFIDSSGEKGGVPSHARAYLVNVGLTRRRRAADRAASGAHGARGS